MIIIRIIAHLMIFFDIGNEFWKGIKDYSFPG